ncbi:MAG: hypothetical protein AAGN15_15790 [Cyanobacteria bacterium J06581_3]
MTDLSNRHSRSVTVWIGVIISVLPAVVFLKQTVIHLRQAHVAACDSLQHFMIGLQRNDQITGITHSS